MQSLVSMMLEDQEGENSDSSIMAGVATFQSMMEITRPVIEGMEEIITPTDLERIANGLFLISFFMRTNKFFSRLFCYHHVFPYCCRPVFSFSFNPIF